MWPPASGTLFARGVTARACKSCYTQAEPQTAKRGLRVQRELDDSTPPCAAPSEAPALRFPAKTIIWLSWDRQGPIGTQSLAKLRRSQNHLNGSALWPPPVRSRRRPDWRREVVRPVFVSGTREYQLRCARCVVSSCFPGQWRHIPGLRLPASRSKRLTSYSHGPSISRSREAYRCVPPLEGWPQLALENPVNSPE